MARKRVIPRAQMAGRDIVPAVEEYLQNRSMRERSEYHEGRLKRNIMEVLEAAGEQVERHKQTITLDTPLPYMQYKGGKPVEKKVVGIERRESVTSTLDQDKALVLLARKKLLDTCTQTVVVVDEDAILAANYAGTITDKELAALYEQSSRFSFWLTEDKDTS
jgi:hypothetical protein